MKQGTTSRQPDHRRSGPWALLAAACLALAALLWLQPGVGARAAAPGPGQPPADLRLVSSGEDEIVLELTVPDLDRAVGEADGAPCDELVVAGHGYTDAAGHPRLPIRGAMVGVPPDGEVRLVILEAEAVDLPGRFQVCPVPRPIVALDEGGMPRPGGFEAARDPEAYATDAYYPAAPAELVSIGMIRDQRVAQVRFQPFQYNPATGQVRTYRQLRVALRLEGGRGTRSLPSVSPADPFEEVLRGTLLNYETAQSWRVAPQPSAALRALPYAGEPAYKLTVDQDGIYQVIRDDMQAAGVDLAALDPRTFRLYDRGQEVAVHVAGEGDGRFDPGDALLFYGQVPPSRYTHSHVYWLTWGGAAGRRMAALDGTPGGTAPTPAYFRTLHRAEEDHNYQAGRPSGPEGDRWYWGWLWADAPSSGSYGTALEHLATEPLSATVRGLFHGYDAVPQHHTRVRLNGYLIDDATWAPTVEYSFTVDVPQDVLVEGTNTFVVECPLDGGITGDYLLVNRFEIEYQRTYQAVDDVLSFDGDEAGTWEYRVAGFSTEGVELYDVTDPLAPARILGAVVTPAGGSYTAAFEGSGTGERHYVALAPTRRLSPAGIEPDSPSSLASPANGADYVIVAPAEMIPAVQPLAAHRAAQGLRTMVVDVQDAYDEFAHGRPDPEAIRDLAAYAYANWQPPAPAYLLLAGDGNYDFKDNLGFGEPSYVPPYLADADPWFGETAADNRYACVSGDDTLPDLHLGRLPVKTAAEAAAVVAKILAYEAAPPGADWHGRVLLAADNADSGGDYDTHADDLADAYLPAPYAATRVYYKVSHATAAAAKAAILATIGEGRLLVYYSGHAAIDFWASEHLLDVADARTLTNGDRLPFAVPMTCLEGYYIHPSRVDLDLSSLAETLVRNPAGGAIASWSPTGMGLFDGHSYLDRALFQALFHDGNYRLGPATTQAKLALYAGTGGYRDLLDTYLLLGDPALALNVLPADLSVVKAASPPGVALTGGTITYTLAFSNVGPATAHNVVLSDDLPAALLDPTFVSAGAAVTPVDGSRLAWSVADLAPGEGGVVTVTATISPEYVGVLTNTARIQATAREATPEDNEARLVTQVVPAKHEVYLPLVRR